MVNNSPSHWGGNGRATDDLAEPNYVQNSQRGGIGMVLSIVCLAIAVFATMGFAWLAISDRMNGLDAWRETDIRKKMEGYRSKCEKKFDDLAALQEWIRQEKLKPPPTLMIDEPCIQPDEPSRPQPKEQ